MNRGPVWLHHRVRGLEPSATLVINERSAAMEADGVEVVRLGLGQSPFPPPSQVVEALRTHATERAYLPVQGLPALRSEVARYHRTENGLATADADRVLVGPGSKELLFLLQLAFEGELLMPTPCWVSYLPQAALVGRRPRLIPTTFESGWRLSPESFEEACESLPAGSPKLLILNYPNNPIGNTYSRERLHELAEVARRHEVLVLSDEIYARLTFSGDHTSIATFYPEGTIVSAGLSKWCGAGGWRLGTFLFPVEKLELLDAMVALASETFTSVSAPIQFAAVRAYEGGPEIESHVSRSRRILSALGKELAGRLRSAGLRVAEPEGGFCLFVDFGDCAESLRSAGVPDSATLAERILEDTGVAVLPGESFGRERSELSARLAYVNFDGGAALDSLSTTGEPIDRGFLDQYCAGPLLGIDRLAAWVRAFKEEKASA